MEVNEPSTRYNENLNGFVKIYRKILSSAVFQEPKLLKVWCWCLIKAYWTPSPNTFHGKQIMLNRGQFITGRFSGAFECHMSPSTFRFQLKKLELFGNISLETDRQKTLVTVTNYSDYQDLPKPNGQRVDNELTTSGQRVDTNEEGKKERKKEERLAQKARPNKEDVINYMKGSLGISNANSEGTSFFDHFESNGWKVGGKAAMKDWQAAARNWVRRSTTARKSVVYGAPTTPQLVVCADCKWQRPAIGDCPNPQCPTNAWKSDKTPVEEIKKQFEGLMNKFSTPVAKNPNEQFRCPKCQKIHSPNFECGLN